MAFEFATFLPSIGSILYLAFAVLFIKELIGLVSSIGGGSGNKGGSVGDKVSGAWDWMKNKNKERIANNEIEAKKRQDELAKEKADSEAVGRYKANMDIKSQQAAQVLSEGTQKLQEFIQNPEYHTYAKDLNEKIVVKIGRAHV